MGFAEFLTLIFVFLNAFNVIDWPWWLVFLPETIALVIYVALFIGIVLSHK